MKTTSAVKITFNIICACILGIGSIGCNGNLFKSLTQNSNIALGGIAVMADYIADVKINSITSTTDDGTYGVGAHINVSVNFSKPVTLSGGTLDVTLNTGRTISVSAGSYPAARLTGTYTVVRGDYSHDVTDVVANLNSTDVTINGGTIVDHMNRNVVVALPDAQQRLGGLKNIMADGRVPTILQVTSSSPDGLYKISNNIDITVNFSRPVTVSGGTLDVTLDTGHIISLAAGSYPTTHLSGTYTVVVGDDSPDLNSTNIALNGATLKDTVGNDADIGIPSEESLADNKNIVVDGVAPYVTYVTSTSNNGIYGLGTSVNVTVQFNEPVTLSGGTMDVTLDTGKTVSVSSGSYPSSQLSGTYTVGTGDVSADLNSTALSLSGGATVRDKAEL